MAEASTPAAQVTSAAPTQSAPDAAPATETTAPEVATQVGRTIGDKPPPFRAKGIADAMQRAQAAIQARSQAVKGETAKPAEKTQQSEAAKATDAPKGKDPASVEAPKVEQKIEAVEAKAAEDPEAKAKEAEKQQRLSRGLAILAEREQKVLASEKRIKAMMAELEQKQSASSDDPFVKLGRQLRDVQAKDGKAGVLKLLGIDLREGVEELARTYEEPTQESIIRKAAAEEVARIQREAKEQEDRGKRESEEKAAAQVQVARAEIADDVTREFLRAVDDFPFVAENSVTAEQVADFALQQEKATGRRPSAIDALKAVEKILEDAAEKANARRTAKAKAAEATQKAQEPEKPAPPPPKAEAKPEPPKQEAKPAEQRGRKESQVKPLASRIKRTTSAQERAHQALVNRGLA